MCVRCLGDLGDLQLLGLGILVVGLQLLLGLQLRDLGGLQLLLCACVRVKEVCVCVVCLDLGGLLVGGLGLGGLGLGGLGLGLGDLQLLRVCACVRVKEVCGVCVCGVP